MFRNTLGIRHSTNGHSFPFVLKLLNRFVEAVVQREFVIWDGWKVGNRTSRRIKGDVRVQLFPNSQAENATRAETPPTDRVCEVR